MTLILFFKTEVCDRPQKFLEVGFGSGAICLSILKERPEYEACGIDISKDAFSLCEVNFT